MSAILESDKEQRHIDSEIKFKVIKYMSHCRGMDKENREILRHHLAQLIKSSANCTYCKKPLEIKQRAVNRIIPRVKGGLFEPGNLAIACHDCSSKKRDLSVAEFTQTILQ